MGFNPANATTPVSPQATDVPVDHEVTSASEAVAETIAAEPVATEPDVAQTTQLPIQTQEPETFIEKIVEEAKEVVSSLNPFQ